MAVDVIKYDEDNEALVKIDANILVMRDSQKRIVVGRGGSMVKKIGIRSRKQIEAMIGCQVHLKLFVKIDPKWLKSAAAKVKPATPVTPAASFNAQTSTPTKTVRRWFPPLNTKPPLPSVRTAA